jgi:hypothetical protein
MNLSTRKAAERRKSNFGPYTDELMCREPLGTSWGDLKYRNIAAPARSTINHIAALKLVRKRIIGQKNPDA